MKEMEQDFIFKEKEIEQSKSSKQTKNSTISDPENFIQPNSKKRTF